MKLSENVETKSNEVKTTDPRASRMSRYSAAAAGVAAVSTLDVDAALVTVDLGSPVGSDTPIDISAATSIDPASIGGGSGFNLVFYQGGIYPGIAAGCDTCYGSSAALSNWFGPNQQIGPSYSYYGGGGFIGSSLSNETAYMGFRVPDDIYSANYIYGYLQFDFDPSQNATVQHWGYESVVNTAVTTTPGVSSSSVTDTGPGVVGLALLGAGAAGMRLLRKLRAGK